MNDPVEYALLRYEREPIEVCKAPYVVVDDEGDVSASVETLAKWLSGEIDKVLGVS